MKTDLTIRPATEEDVPLILDFIRALAEYEKMSDMVTATEADLSESLFGEHPAAECVLAFYDGKPAGFAVYLYNYSTFIGRAGLYLEDLFVRPEFRGHGIGRSMFLHLVQIAKKRKCGRFEWAVLDWNAPAIGFYRKLGAKPMDEWTIFRMDEKTLGGL
jgi:GNAT superfamily N-acetyltransferase